MHSIPFQALLGIFARLCQQPLKLESWSIKATRDELISQFILDPVTCAHENSLCASQACPHYRLPFHAVSLDGALGVTLLSAGHRGLRAFLLLKFHMLSCPPMFCNWGGSCCATTLAVFKTWHELE